MKRIILLLLLFAPFSSLRSQMAIGKWRDCLDHIEVYHVQHAGDRVYASTRGGLFYYDLDDNTLNTLTKSSGLSDVGVSTIGYDASTKSLVIAYENSNVDILCNNRVFNLSDIKRGEIAGDKSIFHVRFHGDNAYLATAFGVVVVNLTRHEISETWYLGTGGVYSPVYDIAFSSDSIYVATAEGVKRLDIDNPHPRVEDRWVTDHRFDTLTVTILQSFADKLLVVGYSYDPNLLTLVSADAAETRVIDRGEILAMHVEGSFLTVVQPEIISRYNTSLSLFDCVSTSVWQWLKVHDAVSDPDGSLWLAHQWSGLAHYRSSYEVASYWPDGPVFSNNNVYRLVPFNYRMMLCPGGHRSTYEGSFIEANLYTSQGLNWQRLDKSNGLLDGVNDLLDVVVNPNDTNEMFATLWGRGVVSIRNNQPQVLYDGSNTNGALIPYTEPGYTTLNTGALAFDTKGDLWVTVAHSPNALAVRRTNGSWESFPTTSVASFLEVDKIVCDSITGYKWMCGRTNVIYVHDGESKFARVDPNHGSKLATSTVTSMVQDQSGNIWLGTDKGLKVIYDGYKAFQNGGNGEVSPVNCSNITISNGEFSEYLMAYESITAIAVDGANRKWVGTRYGGLYLLSSNGMEQLAHFTADNSPLFSNKVIALGINERTGEVYVGTDKGLQVYRGTATYAISQPLSEVYAFPNPVRPDYDGPIAIKGFSRNAIVHITDAAGHTVFSTTANGGQAIWYARNHKGEKVASGVYYVFAADELGNNHSVAKILVIR